MVKKDFESIPDIKNSTIPVQTNIPNIKTTNINLSSSIIKTYNDIENISSSLKSSVLHNINYTSLDSINLIQEIIK